MVNRVVVRNGNEVFTANHNTISVSLYSKPYTKRVLSLPLIDNEIIDLVLNNSGTFLAAVCRHQIYVLVLPPSGFLSSNEQDQGQRHQSSRGAIKEISLTYHQVGATIYSSKNEVIKATWSPTAKYDFTLVVLSGDSVIRSFELANSFNEPQDYFDLINSGQSQQQPEESQPQQQQQQQEASFSINAINSIQKPVGIAFGSQNFNDPVGCLTLYVFTKEGDLYSLYPFNPVNISVPQKFIDLLYDQTTIMFKRVTEELNGFFENNKRIHSSLLDDEGDEEAEVIEKLQLQKVSLSMQLYYVSALYPSDRKIFQKEYKYNGEGILEEFVIVNMEGNSANSSLKLQGPLIIENLPNNLSTDYSIEGCDISCVNNGDTNLINLAFSSGDVLVLIQDNDSIMRWNSSLSDTIKNGGDYLSEYDDDSYRTLDFNEDEIDDDEMNFLLSPSLVVLQCIKLSSRRSAAASLKLGLIPTNTPCLFFVRVNTADGKEHLLKIDLFKWGKELNNLIVENFNQRGEVKVNSLIKSQHSQNFLQIDKIYESGSTYSSSESLVGVSIISDEVQDTFIIYVMNRGQELVVKTISFEKYSNGKELATPEQKQGQQEKQLTFATRPQVEFKLFQRQFENNNLVINNFVKELNDNALVAEFSRVNIKPKDDSSGRDPEVEEYNTNLVLVMNTITNKFMENVLFLTNFQVNLGFNLSSLKQELEYQLVKLNEVIEVIKRVTLIDVSTTTEQEQQSIDPRQGKINNILQRQSKLDAKLNSLISKLEKVKERKQKANNTQSIHNNTSSISTAEQTFFKELQRINIQSSKLRSNYDVLNKQMNFFKNYTAEIKSNSNSNFGSHNSNSGESPSSSILDQQQIAHLQRKLNHDGELIEVSQGVVQQALHDLEQE